MGGGQAITYLVDVGTFYLLPWVNPDGGMNEWSHNPEQRKTNYLVDEPQNGAAGDDTSGDGDVDEDSPDIDTGDVGETSLTGRTIAFVKPPMALPAELLNKPILNAFLTPTATTGASKIAVITLLIGTITKTATG